MIGCNRTTSAARRPNTSAPGDSRDPPPGRRAPPPALPPAPERTSSRPGFGPGRGQPMGNCGGGWGIGGGGMGVGFDGQDIRLQRRVAIKILPLPVTGDDPEQVKRFRREARAATLLNHPNIVSIFDAGFDQGYNY